MKNLIAPQVERLRGDFNLSPVVASEIEFYLYNSDMVDTDKFWTAVLTVCDASGIGIFHHEKEKGTGQFEIALQPSDATRAADELSRVKSILGECASQQDMRADFSAKPYANEPGSGLHIHVHLEDEAGKNVFYKDDATISGALLYSLGGLLALMPDSMPVFAPTDASYTRFIGKTNAPTTVSWGANNRTVAVRLPDAPHDKKRIEHRVAGADADPEKTIAVVLASMHYGLKNQCKPGAQIYGDASLAQYNLPVLPTTLEEAQQRMKASAALKSYLPEIF